MGAQVWVVPLQDQKKMQQEICLEVNVSVYYDTIDCY